ncbi:hypothetical protein TNCV_3197941 [Trichonephila clavipes]|nr:hypothetical protein TNCV_3197941 [Trichonephila clavipes]
MRGQTFGKKGNGYPSELSQRPDTSFCQTEIKDIFRKHFALQLLVLLVISLEYTIDFTYLLLFDTGQDMTAAHLDECSALNDLNCIAKRYWRAVA